MRAPAILGSVVVAAVLATGCQLSEDGASPTCKAARPEPLFLVAQAVPSAELIPCVVSYPGGWSLGTVDVRDGKARLRFDSDRGGRGALTVTLRPECDVAGAIEVPTDEPGTVRYDEMPDVDEGFRGLRTYVFAGGCVTYGFKVSSARAGELVDEGTLAVGFLSRAEVERRIKEGVER